MTDELLTKGDEDRLVLVFVDDSEDDLRKLREFHEQSRYCGIESHFVSSRCGALATFRALELNRLPVCFVDLKIEDEKDGLKLIDELQSIRNDAVYIVLTSEKTVATTIEAMGHGIVDFKLKEEIETRFQYERFLVTIFGRISDNHRVWLTRVTLDVFRASQSLIHDIRRSLSAVERVLDDPDPSPQVLSAARSSMKVLRWMLDDYADNFAFVRDVPDRPLPIDLAEIADGANTFANQRYSDRKLQIDIEQGTCAPKVHKGAIMRIVLNLVDNAFKFSTNAPNEPVIIRIKSDDDELLIEVQDCGFGIRESYQNQILEYAKKGDNNSNFPGLGLGLWYVDVLVKRCSGTLSYQSPIEANSGGTLMRVSLPTVADTTRDAPE